MKVKMERTITVYVNITYKEIEKELLQSFNVSTSRKQDLSYLYDSRFLFKNKIDNIIKENALEGFIRRVDCDDRVEMYYELQSKPSPLIKSFVIYIPPYLGCEYCANAEKKENGFVYCTIKKKHYQKNGIKRCPVFRTMEKILT